jgi:hypothetical protein
MNHREIAVRMAVMNEVQLLFPSEPRSPVSRIELMRSDIEEGDTRTPFVEKDKQYAEPRID